MRVLLLQTVYETSKRLDGLSEWNHHLAIIRSLARRDKRVFFYLAVPRRQSDIQYSDDLFDLPNVKVMPYDYRGYYLMPDEWIKWLSVNTNSVPFDVVWNAVFWENAVIAMVLGSTSVGLSPLVFNFLHETPRTPTLIVHKGMPLVDLTILGGGLQGHLVALTENIAIQLHQISRIYLGGTSLKAFENIDVLPPAVDLNFVDQYRVRFDEERRNREGLVVGAAGGLVEAVRRFVEVAEEVKALKDRGLPIRMKVWTQSPPSKRRGKQLESLGVEVIYECSRERFLSSLGEADVFVEATLDEGTGLSHSEMVLSGMTCIPIIQPWMKGRVPDDYELGVRGMSDVKNYLTAMCRNKQVFESYRSKLERHYRVYHDSDLVADKFVDILQTEINGKEYRLSPSMSELVEKAVGTRDRITIPDLYREMRHHAKSSAVDWSKGTKIWNSFVARRALEHFGFVDLCDGEEPVFVKE